MIFIIALPFAVSAQNTVKVYLKNDRITADSINYDAYRVVDSRTAETFSYTEYHKDGTWVKGNAAGSIENPVTIGDEKHFYKTGKIALVKNYHNGGLTGTIGYYPNGVLMYVLKPSPVFRDGLVLYDADSSGRVHITNGNGVRRETDSIRFLNQLEYATMEGPYKDGLKDGTWKGTDNKGRSIEEQYEAGKLTGGVTIENGKKYKYKSRISYPEFKGGIDKFEARIMASLTRPTDTTGLKFIKPGYLKLGYTITEEGLITSLHGFNKQDNTIVDIALKAELPKVEPARLRGVPLTYTIENNADRFVRRGFTWVFDVAPELRGTIIRR